MFPLPRLVLPGLAAQVVPLFRCRGWCCRCFRCRGFVAAISAAQVEVAGIARADVSTAGVSESHVEAADVAERLQRGGIGRLGGGVQASGGLDGPHKLRVKRRRLGAERLVGLRVPGKQRRDDRRHLIGTGGHHPGGRQRRRRMGRAEYRSDSLEIRPRRGQHLRHRNHKRHCRLLNAHRWEPPAWLSIPAFQRIWRRPSVGDYLFSRREPAHRYARRDQPTRRVRCANGRKVARCRACPRRVWRRVRRERRRRHPAARRPGRRRPQGGTTGR